MRTCAGAFLISNGKVLLVKRALHKSFPGCWDVPGGHSEPGETPAQTIVRELAEELGIMVDQPMDGLGTSTVLRAPELVLHLYTIRSWTGIPAMLGDEHTELRWLTYSEAAAIEPLVTEHYREILLGIAD